MHTFLCHPNDKINVTASLLFIVRLYFIVISIILTVFTGFLVSHISIMFSYKISFSDKFNVTLVMMSDILLRSR